MKIRLVFLLLLGALPAAAQVTALPPAAASQLAARPPRPKPAAPTQAVATVAADTLVARQFLAAVADTLVADSTVVARYMCADGLLHKREPRLDTVVARLRVSLYFLRASLVRHADSVRRSRLAAFREVSRQLPFELAESEGAYVLVAGNQPRLCLLVRNGKVAAFELSFYEGPKRAHFRDYYCR